MNLFLKTLLAIALFTIEINTQCSTCAAPKFYEVAPVCGLNNVTYKNVCYADCNKQVV